MNPAPSVAESQRASPGEMAFRVVGSTRDGQIVRLRSPKCTVGSASGCTLRIQARGVRPVHCYLVRGPGGTIARRFDGDTRLNGGWFDDALLGPGDRLACGPIQLEMLPGAEPQASQSVTPVEAPAAEAVQEPSSAPALVEDEALREIDQRLTTLTEQLEEIARREAEMESRSAGWDTQQRRQQDYLAKRSEEVDQQAVEVEWLLSQLKKDRASWEGERHDAERRLGEQSEQLRHRQAELDAQRQSLVQLEAELESRRAVLAQQPVEMAAPVDPPGQSRASRADEIVFGRLRGLEVLKDETSKQPAPTSLADTKQATPSPGAVSPAEQEADHTRSVESYMTALLNRVRGTSESATPAATSTESSWIGAAPLTSLSSSPIAAPDREPSVASDDTAGAPRERSRPKPAPEGSSDIAAMRELANLSTQEALFTSSRQRRLVDGLGKLGIAATGFTVGIYLLCFGPQGSPLELYAGLASLVVGGLWLVRGATLLMPFRPARVQGSGFRVQEESRGDHESTPNEAPSAIPTSDFRPPTSPEP